MNPHTERKKLELREMMNIPNEDYDESTNEDDDEYT
jgi:hypothetical protein